MKDPLITIIVPIYKVENYIDRCIQSILCQTYKNIEIFLVDDGSPDKCGEIIDQYAQVDSRIVALHKENGGLSDARNYATPLAHGDFLTFVDSDDWISPYYIENLYNTIARDGADLAISWFTVTYEDKTSKDKYYNELEGYELISSIECLRRMFYQNGIETSAWGKLYKKSSKDLLAYPKGKLYEDIPVTYAVIKQAKKIAIIKNEDYYYFQRPASIQNKAFDLRKLDAIEHMSNVVADVECCFPGLTKAVHCRYFSCVCNILFQITDEKYAAEKELLWKEVCKYRREVFHDREASKKSRIAAFLSFLGFRPVHYVYTISKKKAI